MRRLDTLLFHNNSISRVHPQIGNSLPNLTSLMLTNNKINNYYEVEHLSSLKKLSFLSLLENPLTFRQYYREFTIFKLPQLKVLDFQKITIKEKKNIKQFFETNPAGKQFLVQVENEKQSYYQQLSQRQQQNAIPAAVPPPASNPSPVAPTVSLTEEQKNQVRAAIENASTKEEIDRIEQQLKVSQTLHNSLYIYELNYLFHRREHFRSKFRKSMRTRENWKIHRLTMQNHLLRPERAAKNIRIWMSSINNFFHLSFLFLPLSLPF